MSRVIKRRLIVPVGFLGLALALFAVSASAVWASVPHGSGGGYVDLSTSGMSGTVWALIGAAIAAALLAIVLTVRMLRRRSRAAVIPLRPSASFATPESAMTSEEPTQSKAA